MDVGLHLGSCFMTGKQFRAPIPYLTVSIRVAVKDTPSLVAVDLLFMLEQSWK